MKKRKLSTLLLISVFLVGLSLLLYPVVSNYWNSLHQSRAIANYMDSMTKIDPAHYEKILDDARAYNRSLPDKAGRLSPTDAEKEQFHALLASNGSAVGYIEIPSIRVKLPIYLGDEEAILQAGVGLMYGTSIPIDGESVHAALTGHRGLPTATLFSHLDRLVPGDLFRVYILEETVTYEVDQILIVEPQDVDALKIVAGMDYATLVTCTPYGINSHRMLVRGHRVTSPDDVLYAQVSAEAMQIEPLIIAPLVAVPILILLLILVLFGGRRRSYRTHLKDKKGGNIIDDNQKTDL